MDPGSWIKFFVENPGATVAIAEGIALGYMFKQFVKAKDDALTIAREVLPVATKLAEGIDALDRMSERPHRE